MRTPRPTARSLAAIILGISLALTAMNVQAALAEPPASDLPAWAQIRMPKAVPIQASSVKGHGPIPLVIIAELGADETAYEPFAERHAERFTTHTLCLPGSTKDSRGPQLHRGQVNDPEWLLNAVNAVAGYVRENKLDKPVILGHSMGGMVAYMLSIREPELAKSYVIVNMLPARGVGAPGRIPDKVQRAAEVDSIERGVILETKRNMYLNKIRDTVPTQCRTRKFADEMINRYSRVPLLAVQRYELESLYLDLREDLDRVKTPMLIIGTLPEWFPRLDGEVLRAAFQNVGFNRPNVRVEILDNVRQWGIIEEPDRFDPPMLEFLGMKPDVAAPDEKANEKPAGAAEEKPVDQPAGKPSDTPNAPADPKP